MRNVHRTLAPLFALMLLAVLFAVHTVAATPTPTFYETLVVEDTVATTVTVMDWPGDRVPGPQVRVAGPVAGTGAHDPWVEVAAVTVMPAGTESVTLTLVAEDGPELVATMV